MIHADGDGVGERSGDRSSLADDRVMTNIVTYPTGTAITDAPA